MKKFSTVASDGKVYEFTFTNGRLMSVVIKGATLSENYGEYVASERPDSSVSVKHFERCFKLLCEDKDFTEYEEFMTEITHPSNNPELAKVAKKILLKKRKLLISRIRKMTKAINKI